jgi:hypothetical protein
MEHLMSIGTVAALGGIEIQTFGVVAVPLLQLLNDQSGTFV